MEGKCGCRGDGRRAVCALLGSFPPDPTAATSVVLRRVVMGLSAIGAVLSWGCLWCLFVCMVVLGSCFIGVVLLLCLWSLFVYLYVCVLSFAADLIPNGARVAVSADVYEDDDYQKNS